MLLPLDSSDFYLHFSALAGKSTVLSLFSGLSQKVVVTYTQGF